MIECAILETVVKVVFQEDDLSREPGGTVGMSLLKMWQRQKPEGRSMPDPSMKKQGSHSARGGSDKEGDENRTAKTKRCRLQGQWLGFRIFF